MSRLKFLALITNFSRIQRATPLWVTGSWIWQSIILSLATALLIACTTEPTGTSAPAITPPATAITTPTPAPTATPTLQPTATPNLEATVEARIAATVAAIPTATLAPTPTATIQPPATPNLEATAEAQIAATPVAMLTATSTPVLAETPTTAPAPTPTATPTPVPTAAPASASDRMDEIDCPEPCAWDTVPIASHVDWVQKPQISASGILSLTAQINDGHNLILPGGASGEINNISLTESSNLYGSVVPPSQPGWNWNLKPGLWIADTYTYQARILTVIAQIDPAAATHPGLKVCLWSGGDVSEAYILGCADIEQP